MRWLLWQNCENLSFMGFEPFDNEVKYNPKKKKKRGSNICTSNSQDKKAYMKLLCDVVQVKIMLCCLHGA